MVSEASAAHFHRDKTYVHVHRVSTVVYAILSRVSAQEQVLVAHMQQVPFCCSSSQWGPRYKLAFFFLLLCGLLTNLAQPDGVFLFVPLQARSSSISQSFIWFWQASLFCHFG